MALVRRVADELRLESGQLRIGRGDDGRRTLRGTGLDGGRLVENLGLCRSVLLHRLELLLEAPVSHGDALPLDREVPLFPEPLLERLGSVRVGEERIPLSAPATDHLVERGAQTGITVDRGVDVTQRTGTSGIQLVERDVAVHVLHRNIT